MKIRQIILVIILAVLTSCNYMDKQTNSQSQKDSIADNHTNNVVADNKTTFDIDFEFKVIVGQEEDFKNFKTYTYFELMRENKTIYVDSSLTEYEFGDKLYPIVLQTGENSFELLFEINDRPNKNFLKRLFIQNNKIVKQDKLPTFISKPTDINKDGIKEYAGFWDYSEPWGDNSLTAYNPILYYILTETGLQLDSLLTKERNENIYGQFYGFSYNENNEQPISVIDKFDEEIKLITNGQ
ncbi:hypothetical protein FACS18945_3970 [Bacteroidia bacterium]|nr:hypothetical protein FACS18945_3970 [Bacteroidia bacterium]